MGNIGVYFCLLFLCSTVVFGISSDSGNKHCNVTYRVQQLYQACPPKGPIIHTASPGGDGSDSDPRLDTLEAKYNTLEAMYRELNAKLLGGCGSSGSNVGGNSGVNKETDVHNVTKADGSYPQDCSDIFAMGHRCTGVYMIKPTNAIRPFQAFCELAYDGWTVILRRFDGKVSFYRLWNEYKQGFGSVSGEHWLGNDHIHFLTSQKNYELRIEFTYWASSISYYAAYMRFKIESEANKYKLHVTGYTGNSGYDGISAHNNQPFSTWDRDNDSHGQNCAQNYKGAFWYKACHHYSVPTGMYKQSCGGHDCIEWKIGQALKAITMKIKSI